MNLIESSITQGAFPATPVFGSMEKELTSGFPFSIVEIAGT